MRGLTMRGYDPAIRERERAFGLSKSAISDRFVLASAEQVLWLANSYSRRRWCLVQAATMLPPAIGSEIETAGFRRLYRSLPLQ